MNDDTTNENTATRTDARKQARDERARAKEAARIGREQARAAKLEAAMQHAREREQAREQARQAREQALLAKEERAQRRFVRAGNHVGVTVREVEGPASINGDIATTDVGNAMEDLAARLYEENGYRIVERNYRCKLGELDIVVEAPDEDLLAFVEVRSRTSDEQGSAAESVTPRKQAKVSKVAEMYLLERRPPNDQYRFDVVAIDGPNDITIYEDAWRLGLWK